MNKKTRDAAKYSISAGALGAATVSLLAWALSLKGLVMPSEVVASLTVIFSFAVNIILVRTGVISEV